MKKGNEPAYPFITWNEPGNGNSVAIYSADGSKQFIPYTPRMTIRQKIGADVLCALMSIPVVVKSNGKVLKTANDFSMLALEYTDAFLNAESETRDEK
jgi:hypothetical protein